MKICVINDVQRLATTDELTGVHNRRSLTELGEREIQRAVRYWRALSAIMLDVDHFKHVNDSWGHGAGDAVLREVAQVSAKQIRRTDAIARYTPSAENAENIIGRFGGEEFGILLPETTLAGA
jgi:two-component system cell cycle response regulator